MIIWYQRRYKNIIDSQGDGNGECALACPSWWKSRGRDKRSDSAASYLIAFVGGHGVSCCATDTDPLHDLLSSERTRRVYVPASYGQPWNGEGEEKRGRSVSTPRSSPRLARYPPVVLYTVRRDERAKRRTTPDWESDPDRSERMRGEVIAWKNVLRRRTTRSRIIFYEGIVSVLYIGSLTTRCFLVVAGVARSRFLIPVCHTLAPCYRRHVKTSPTLLFFTKTGLRVFLFLTMSMSRPVLPLSFPASFSTEDVTSASNSSYLGLRPRVRFRAPQLLLTLLLAFPSATKDALPSVSLLHASILFP